MFLKRLPDRQQQLAVHLLQLLMRRLLDFGDDGENTGRVNGQAKFSDRISVFRLPNFPPTILTSAENQLEEKISPECTNEHGSAQGNIAVLSPV
jgi:hypothetical protein